MLRYRFLGNLIYLVVRLMYLTFRIEFKVGSFAAVAKHHPKGSYLAALWHQDLILGILAGYKSRRHATLVSSSKDGEIAATVLKRLGLIGVRGSSKKEGQRAKDELEKIISTGTPAAITIDGPKGPIFEVKSGIIELSQKTGIPIIPYLAKGKNNWVLSKSWDKMRIPKPFTKVFVYIGEPICVSPELDRENYGEIKNKIKSELFKAEEILNEMFKNE